MITFLTVGRNDGYGVNLAKRTALSLNYFASLCEDADDELVYVDCNSPEDDCTLVESIADTLTPEARNRLKVFRVSGEQMLGAIGETPLPFSDELSRNVGIRRSNPANTWLLSTNCDILLHPIGDTSLHAILRGLEPRYHACPRIGVPPAQWQRLDRMDVAQMADFCDAVVAQGVRLPPEVEQPWLRYHAAGDFQLAPRSQWLEIGGCEEAMKFWGHSDANNALRLSLLNGGGRTPDLQNQLRPIHLDHNLPSLSGKGNPPPKNDWAKWIDGVTSAKSTNVENWGLADVTMEPVRLEVSGGREIVKTHKRQRNLLRSLKMRVLNRFWNAASRAANKVGPGK